MSLTKRDLYPIDRDEAPEAGLCQICDGDDLERSTLAEGDAEAATFASDNDAIYSPRFRRPVVVLSGRFTNTRNQPSRNQ